MNKKEKLIEATIKVLNEKSLENNAKDPFDLERRFTDTKGVPFYLQNYYKGYPDHIVFAADSQILKLVGTAEDLYDYINERKNDYEIYTYCNPEEILKELKSSNPDQLYKLFAKGRESDYSIDITEEAHLKPMSNEEFIKFLKTKAIIAFLNGTDKEKTLENVMNKLNKLNIKYSDNKDNEVEEVEEDNTLKNPEQFYQFFKSNINDSTKKKAAKILFDWYQLEETKYVPDVEDISEMVQAADNGSDKDIVIKAMGYDSEMYT